MTKAFIRDIANSLPHMIIGRMSREDFEVLAALQDGVLTVDLLAVTAHHTAGFITPLSAVDLLAVWLKNRLAHQPMALSLVKAALSITIKTDRVPADRARMIPFEFSCDAMLATADWTYQAKPAFKRIWYNRLEWWGGITP